MVNTVARWCSLPMSWTKAKDMWPTGRNRSFDKCASPAHLYHNCLSIILPVFWLALESHQSRWTYCLIFHRNPQNLKASEADSIWQVDMFWKPWFSCGDCKVGQVPICAPLEDQRVTLLCPRSGAWYDFYIHLLFTYIVNSYYGLSEACNIYWIKTLGSIFLLFSSNTLLLSSQKGCWVGYGHV
jgi:hypothetical protein